MIPFLTDPGALRADALVAPTATAAGSLPAEMMRYAGRGWYTGLSINA